MKNVMFSETRNIEKILQSRAVTQDNIGAVISSLAKYNLQIRTMSDEENFDDINRWLKESYNGYVETEFFDVINAKIAAAHKYGLLESDDLIVYQSELDKIVAVNDIRHEKILFALLCIAKLQKNTLGYQNGKYKFALTNIFKLARVHIPASDRDALIHSLYKTGFISAPFKNSDNSRWITFMSDGINDTAVITLNEIDFEELAFVYEYWKNNNEGFTRCKCCNRLMRDRKRSLKSKSTNTKKYCEQCSKEITQENWREASQKYYDSHKN